MILNIGGKSLAFGMRWQILVRAEAPGREARAAKSPLMWVDSAREYFGILAPDETIPKGGDRIYSASQALLNIPQSSTNMLLVMLDPHGDGYLVCGVMQKRPRNGFDAANVDDATLGELLARFTDLCGDDGFDLLGDAPLDGISALTLDELSDAADEHCLLRSSGSVARYVAYGALGLLVLSVSVLAYHHHKRKLAQEADANRKSPADQYAESVAARGKIPTFSSKDISAWENWAESLPPIVGGWDISDVICNLSPEQSQFSCVISYKRGTSPLATNRTFADAAPKGWESIHFSNDAKTIDVDVATKVPLVPTASVLAAAVPPRAISLDFGSTLQTLVNVSKKTALGSQYDLFGLPVGMVPSTVPSPTLMTSWTVEGPYRLLDAVSQFPRYTTIDHIALAVKPSAQGSTNSSIAMITVGGNVYAKQ